MTCIYVNKIDITLQKLVDKWHKIAFTVSNCTTDIHEVEKIMGYDI